MALEGDRQASSLSFPSSWFPSPTILNPIEWFSLDLRGRGNAPPLPVCAWSAQNAEESFGFAMMKTTRRPNQRLRRALHSPVGTTTEGASRPTSESQKCVGSVHDKGYRRLGLPITAALGWFGSTGNGPSANFSA